MELEDQADVREDSSTAASQRRRAIMVERLTNLQDARRNAAAALRSEKSSQNSAPLPFESVAGFLSRFSGTKRSIEDRLSNLRSDPVSDPKTSLDSVSASIHELENLVAESSYFLPPYEVRSCLKSISDLKETLESLSSELIPRKKFSFKNKPSKKTLPLIAPQEEETTIAAAVSSDLDFRDSPGFRNRKGELLIKRFLNASSDFTLADLDSCEVYLKGITVSLFVHRIRNCRVFAGPVLGSIHAEDIDSCVLMLASHQIRIHDAKNTDFYLRVRSRPIIEGCYGVRFATYLLTYEGIEEELESSGLHEENENWAKVDDFKWLRAVPSPNWCVVPKDEQSIAVDISDKVEEL